jgi:translocation and assembly module TamB
VHLVERWGQGSAVLRHRDNSVRLESADFAGKGGRLAATGEMRLDAARGFSARFDLAAVDPAQFGKFPRGQLNARGQVTGVLAPALQLATEFTLPPGTLEGRPVRGGGRFRYGGGHVADADVDVDVAGNRARARGSYGSAGDRLLWDVDAPALGRLKLGLAGSVKSRGSASGAPAELQIEGHLAARELRVRDVLAADTLDVVLDMQATPQGAFNGQIDGRGLTVAGQRLSFVRATSSGKRDAHTLNVDVRRQDWRVTALLAGGLDANEVWRGELRQAEAHGPWPMVLRAPATLVLSRTQQQVDDLAFTVAGGDVRVEQFERRGAELASRGSAANVPLAPLLTLVERPLPFTTDLRASGEWDLRVGDTVDGTLRLRRESGDVRVDDPALALGLTTVTLDVDARASQLHVRVAAASRDAGELRGEARTTLVREDGVFTLGRTAPLTWSGELDAPDLRLVKPFLPVGVRADARVAARLSGSGSLAAPRIDGTVTAEAIRFAMPEEGVSITDGRLALVLDDDRIRVEDGELKGQSGRIVVAGEAQLKNPQAGLTLTFEKFAASNRSDRRVIVSGTTRLALNQQRLRLDGELRADRARLETPEASRPTLSPDVVVVGRPPREPSAVQRMPLELDLRLDLGDDFLFKGSGLDAKLGGKLRVFTVADVLRAEGRIRVVTGRYAAYGQTLAIERGELVFAGPIDDPGIDVLAVRKTPTVKAGVQVRGTVQRPLVTLYSDPAMPDTEKLSWLVLGRGLEGGSQQEFALLQLAAGALLSQAESVNMQAQIAEVLRIDTFGVRAGEGEDLATTVVSLGKRLSSRATLSYEQSLDGLNQGVKVLYQLSPHVRLEAQAGQQSSFDAFYTREYD